MSDSAQPQLVRAIGRWTLAALVVNSIIGSGIFGMPDDIARLLGPAAPYAYLIAAAGIGIIMACFAEVGSQFREAGGPYLYARETFGQLAGVQMGWFAWLVRLTSAAANANIFVLYLGEFWKGATSPAPRAFILTLVLCALAVVNVRGVRAGAQVSNFFTAAKLVPLAIFVVAGFWFVGGKISVGASPAGMSDWMAAVLALIFAYGGFEAALMPMGEVKDPRRDTPFALFVALAVCAVFYSLIHLVVMGALADPGASERPLSDAARVFLGNAGAGLVALGAMVSTYGYLSGQFVSAPRLTYAFAERRDFPPFFAAVHPRFRTPYVSILVYTVLALSLAIYGSFIWNAILSAVARLFTYGLVCAALIRLRIARPHADSFRLPAGWLFALAGMAFCVVMVLQMNRDHLKIVLAVTVVASLNWLLARRGSSAAPSAS
ncbi:MAG: APC family permease [Acidobacteria bacterium]|nr:APC family permease [Acidobacteriota bacterium]MCL5287460.1 APC family permease [Acidobacteriota bacterium]